MGKYITPKEFPSDTVCRRLVIPADVDFLELVNGALSTLIHDYNFEQLEPSDLTPEQTAEFFQGMFLEYLEGEACTLGSVVLYATSTTPTGTLPCDGNTYLRTDYPKLYAVLAADYIVDTDHFKTPSPVGLTGLNYYIVAR